MARIERYTSPDGRCQFDLRDDGGGRLMITSTKQARIGFRAVSTEMELSKEHVGFLMAGFCIEAVGRPSNQAGNYMSLEFRAQESEK